MKLYISADIEGIAGVVHVDETDMTKPSFGGFARQMTREVTAACEGATSAGAGEIWINDAHWTGRNIVAASLPRNTRLIRGWSEHPYFMMQELDESFDAAGFIGYHSPASTGTNPLAHTMSDTVSSIRVNGHLASELLINAFTAADAGVPVVFVSGDEGLCNHAREIHPEIVTIAVKRGIGGSTVSIHPEVAAERIRDVVATALQKDLGDYRVNLPDRFKIEMSFHRHVRAYRASFYPGVNQTSDHEVTYETKTWFDVLRMFLFVL
jgi:D-amino peptidase